MDTRKHDIEQVNKGIKSSDPTERMVATIAGEKIASQRHDHWLGRARKELVKERINGNKDNARQISEDIYKHEKGGYGASSWTFSIPDHLRKK